MTFAVFSGSVQPAGQAGVVPSVSAGAGEGGAGFGLLLAAFAADPDAAEPAGEALVLGNAPPGVEPTRGAPQRLGLAWSDALDAPAAAEPDVALAGPELDATPPTRPSVEADAEPAFGPQASAPRPKARTGPQVVVPTEALPPLGIRAPQKSAEPDVALAGPELDATPPAEPSVEADSDPGSGQAPFTPTPTTGTSARVVIPTHAFPLLGIRTPQQGAEAGGDRSIDPTVAPTLPAANFEAGKPEVSTAASADDGPMPAKPRSAASPVVPPPGVVTAAAGAQANAAPVGISGAFGSRAPAQGQAGPPNPPARPIRPAKPDTVAGAPLPGAVSSPAAEPAGAPVSGPARVAVAPAAGAGDDAVRIAPAQQSAAPSAKVAAPTLLRPSSDTLANRTANGSPPTQTAPILDAGTGLLLTIAPAGPARQTIAVGDPVAPIAPNAPGGTPAPTSKAATDVFAPPADGENPGAAETEADATGRPSPSGFTRDAGAPRAAAEPAAFAPAGPQPQPAQAPPALRIEATARPEAKTPAPFAGTNPPTLPPVPLAAVAAVIARRAESGARHFRIRLDPPELGRIEVRLEVTPDRQVTTHIQVERSETLDLLHRDGRLLERSLAQAGFDSQDGGPTFSLKDQGGQRSRGELFRGDPQELTVTAEADAGTPAPVARTPLPRSALDIRI